MINSPSTNGNWLNRIVEYANVPPGTLNANPQNFRRHPQAQADALSGALNELGWLQDVVVNRTTGLILDGHLRVELALKHNEPSVPVKYVELSEAEERLALATLDAITGQATIDPQALMALLGRIEMQNVDDDGLLALLGQMGTEAQKQLPREAVDAEPQIEDFPVADLLAPYPYFGGKRAIAGAVWARFGEVQNYVEPFFGSGAVLLSRPHAPGIETINDLDGFIANFWRAVATRPKEVARHVDWPVNENDLFARHLWLVQQRTMLADRLHSDPDYCDAKIAGWWCWGACAWIGGGWCDGDGPWRVDGDTVGKLPHLGNPGRGVTDDQCALWSEHLAAMMQRLSDRLRRVRVACGDWSRVATGAVTDRHGLTGIFLDPPYAEGAMEYSAGGNSDNSITEDVRAWCVENGDNPQMRIAFCGYEPLSMPGYWKALRWTAPKGYQNAENEKNRRREMIWFSPHCLTPQVDATATTPQLLEGP